MGGAKWPLGPSLAHLFNVRRSDSPDMIRTNTHLSRGGAEPAEVSTGSSRGPMEASTDHGKINNPPKITIINY